MNKLIEWFKAERGRRIKLAKHLDISPAAVSQWVLVPFNHLDKIASFTGIPKSELRPDIFKGFSPDQPSEAATP